MLRELPSLTIRDAAEILRRSPYTVGCMVRARRLPHYRIGGRIYFREDELVMWIEAQHVPATVSEDQDAR